MKFLAVIGLVGTLLTGSIGVSTAPASTAGCQHTYTTVMSAGTRAAGGYTHTYNTSSGIVACNVTVYHAYTQTVCNTCHEVLRTDRYPQGDIEVHSQPEHK